MYAFGSDERDFGTPPGQFRTTRWSVAEAAGRQDDANRGRALEGLCRSNGYPVYAFIRRRGHEVADAPDLTHGFFAHVDDEIRFLFPAMES